MSGTTGFLTYPKRAADLLPGHVVLGTAGELWRVVGNEPLSRHARRLTLRNEATGDTIQRTTGAAFEVRCVEVRA